MFEKIRDMLAEQLDIDPETITEETDIAEDLGADSLDVVELLDTIEKEFNIAVPQDSIADAHTVKDVADLIEKLL